MDEEYVELQRMRFWCDAFVMTLRVDHQDVATAAETADHAVKALNKRLDKGEFSNGG
jgi:hypothetical protein